MNPKLVDVRKLSVVVIYHLHGDCLMRKLQKHAFFAFFLLKTLK
jgi:hypothetical protein